MSKTHSIELSGKQNRFLRGLGHNLSPAIMIGKNHLNKDVVEATLEALERHELIKVKIQEGCLEDRRMVATSLSQLTDSALVQLLGKTFLLYRPSKDKLIQLP